VSCKNGAFLLRRAKFLQNAANRKAGPEMKATHRTDSSGETDPKTTSGLREIARLE